jgi:uncharacterized RDD family membrane protein YckC
VEANPYAAPAAVLEDARRFTSGELEVRKTTRIRRLVAAVLDVLTAAVGWALIFWGMTRPSVVYIGSNRPPDIGPFVAFSWCGTGVLVGLAIVNCIFLHRYGQTLGKRALKIAIVRADGERVGLSRVLMMRALPISLIMMIPWFGKVGWLVDVLMIFGNDRRCLHDLVADTIVVDI